MWMSFDVSVRSSVQISNFKIDQDVLNSILGTLKKPFLKKVFYSLLRMNVDELMYERVILNGHFQREVEPLPVERFKRDTKKKSIREDKHVDILMN
jgi:hypothetical protein